MSDLNIVALKRKAGCSEACRIAVRRQGMFLSVSHGETKRAFAPDRPEWVNGVIEWLRSLKHE